MTRDEKRQKLESFGRGPALLSAALRNLPKRMWLYRPAADRWSIHEIIHHLADSEASGYVQCRRSIAEPGSRALQLNAVRWANSLGYFHQNTRESLDMIRRLRKMTYQLLVNLPEHAWARGSEGGKPILEVWLDRQERHIPHHVDQMNQNYQIWLGDNPPRKGSLRASRPNTASPRAALSLSRR